MNKKVLIQDGDTSKKLNISIIGLNTSGVFKSAIKNSTKQKCCFVEYKGILNEGSTL